MPLLSKIIGGLITSIEIIFTQVTVASGWLKILMHCFIHSCSRVEVLSFHLDSGAGKLLMLSV